MYDWLYNYLLNHHQQWKGKSLYEKLFGRIRRQAGTVTTRLHGFKARIPSSYMYPIINRMFPTYNNPYLELAWQTFQTKKQKINVIDVGAAIGDTFLLLDANMPEGLKKVYCVEGLPEFLSYLEFNLSNHEHAVIINQLFSDKPGPIPALVKHHSGSAMASGSQMLEATTIDIQVSSGRLEKPHLVKIDVDGWDGKVLGGAAHTLEHHGPNVIFEYHPILLKQAGNSLSEPFEILQKAGYSEMLWFDKFGSFSHSASANNSSLFQQTATECLNSSRGEDWHYDVIALKDGHQLNLEALKRCEFASRKKHPY